MINYLGVKSANINMNSYRRFLLFGLDVPMGSGLGLERTRMFDQLEVDVFSRVDGGTSRSRCSFR